MLNSFFATYFSSLDSSQALVLKTQKKKAVLLVLDLTDD